MNVFVSRISHNSWVTPVTLMCLILGFMIAMARVTGSVSRDTRRSFLTPDQTDRVMNGPLDLRINAAKLSDEVQKLQLEKTRLENAVANQTNSTKVLNDNLQDAKIFAGLTELEGPGVIVTLRDSAKPMNALPTDSTIHDTDVLKVVNELWASGAEAVSVNNHRVVGSTSFRCVGPVIHVDGVPIATPVTIRAIGDTDTLSGGLNLPGGVLSEIRQTDPSMVQLEAAKLMRLPAYNGPTTRKHSAVPKVDKK